MKKRFLSVILAIILVMAIFTVSVSAAEPTISASASASSVSIGDTVKISVKLSHPDSKLLGAIGTIDFPSNFEFSSISTTVGDVNSNKLSSTRVKFLLDNENPQKNITITLNFKAKKASNTGEFKVETTGETVDDEKTTTSTLNVRVVDKAALPNNANASSIVIKPATAGKLVPDFKPDITSYNVNVDYSVTEVLLSVAAQDNKAQISIEGSKNMKVGANTRTVVITAQNGTVKKYTINIYRAPSGETTPDPEPPVVDPTVNPYEITVDGKTKYMVQNYTDIAVPDGFSESTHTIGDAEVPVLKDVVSSKIVVYATDGDGSNGIYCLYNSAENTFTHYRYMETGGVKLIILNYTGTVPTLKNYFYTLVNVEGNTVSGFKYNDSAMADFIIFYAETGENQKDFYRYDTKEKTLQRAVEFVLEFESVEQSGSQDSKNVIARFLELDTKSKAIVISGVAVIVILLILIVVVIVKLTRRPVSSESLEAAREQPFMEGFGKADHLFIGNDDDSVLDEDFRFKDGND